MVGGEVGVLEDRRHFVLARRDFVVARLDRHAHLVQLVLDFHHELEHALGDGAEILIFEFLALRRLGAEQRAAGVDQVGAREIEIAIDQEVFLLGTAGRDDVRRLRAEQLQDAYCLRRQRFHRAEQRRLLVERFTGPADERGRDDQRRAGVIHQQPGRAGRVPRRVAARFERAAHAAGREARRVGLALNQFLAAELRDRAALGRRREEGVVLLGGDAGQRLEPVRVVRGAMFDRPVLDSRGDGVGNRGIEQFTVRDGAAQGFVCGLRKTGPLHLVVEDEAPENLCGPGGPDPGGPVRRDGPIPDRFNCFT